MLGLSEGFKLTKGFELGDSVLLVPVIVSIPIATLPVLSVAVTVTLVFPIGNDDPLAWLITTIGLESQSSSALAEKVTMAD
jgi:hypothetical protein